MDQVHMWIYWVIGLIVLVAMSRSPQSGRDGDSNHYDNGWDDGVNADFDDMDDRRAQDWSKHH